LRRERASFRQFLVFLLDIPGLPGAFQDRLRALLEQKQDPDAERVAEVVEDLLEAGLLLARARPEGGVWRLEDAANRRIFHVRGLRRPQVRYLDPPEAIPALATLPVESPPSGNLPDLLLDPRRLLTRLEEDLRRALWGVEVRILPRELPPDWILTLDTSVPPAPAQRAAELLASAPGKILYVPEAGRLGMGQGSLLMCPLGSGEPRWSVLLEFRSPRPDGFPPPVRQRIWSLAKQAEQRIEMALRLQALVFRDVLTGVYNRAYFEDQVGKEIQLAKRKGESLGLCIIDIDDFKTFNTRFGYAGGDRVLREVAQRLRASLRASDTLARYGGDEFAALLAPPLTPQEAAVVARRLQEAVRSLRFPLEDLEGTLVQTRVTVSIGGAIYPEDGTDLQSLWAAANREILRAKAEGKDRFAFPQRGGADRASAG
jgi:diguanylate cyclase (GGDEF)-like protein